MQASVKEYFATEGSAIHNRIGYVLEAADAVLFSEAAIERAAKATYAEGAFCGTCEFEGWDSCADCRRCNMDYARAVVAALREET
ncbi:hypothetical protein PP356_gp44 [Arthrobacter phage MargaretKali]|uniref:Uncharacterized protein n=1 Tax=Arthrobacter phage MargaretKali TaxID=2250414 RepID=A0A345KN22_9CAUD|nr:hypothetical protein PP356_gp44 [Arthrobacter phage MargaretKali]AXH44424.1 hypothetical protein SEA_MARGARETKALI_44 [Arthrobacter phage MargaretKali]